MKKLLTLLMFFLVTTFASNAEDFVKVTDASTLKAGDVLIIGCSSESKVAGSLGSSILSSYNAANFSSGSTVSIPDNALSEISVFTLGGSAGAWTLTTSNGALGATAVKKLAWGSGTTTWSISISNGLATIQNGTSSYGKFLYNVGSPRFTTYTSGASTSMLLPELYRKQSATPQTVATPTFSPAEGTFTEAQNVTISCETEGATIHYTTDGTTPDAQSNVYSSAITVSETTTIKAIAIKDGVSSEVASATYTIEIPKTMTSIAISGTPTTTTYTVGDSFSTAGLSVIATYSDNSNETITEGIEWTVDPETFTTAGENVTVQVLADYNNLTSDIAEYTVTVNAPKTMTSIAIIGTPTTTTYTIGEAFSTDGLSVIATYSDNSNETITDGIEWTVDPETFTAAGENVTVQVLAGYNNLTSDIAEYTVTVEEAPAPGGNDFTLVTSTSDLVAGREYIIVNQEKAVAMSTTQNGNNRGQTAVELSTDKSTATINDDTQVFTLEGSSSGWYFNTGAGYIYAASSSSNYLRTETTKDDNAKAAITFSDNIASIVFQGNYTRNVLQYNSSSSIFSCYSSASQKPVYLYYRNAGPAKTMTSIAISGTPTTTTYTVGEAFSTAGLSVIATYSDNSTETITDGIEWEIDPTTFDTAGENVTVSVMAGYNNLTSDIAEYTVTVNVPVTMTSIAISGTPTTTTYTVGEAFSTDGLSVIATYSDNSNETITEGIEWTVDPETFGTVGEEIPVSVTATYKGEDSEAANFTVTVNKKASSISIENITVEVGKTATISATTTPTDAELTYTIAEGGESYISIEDGVITGIAEGTATVTANYTGNDEYEASTKEFTVTVVPASSSNTVVLSGWNAFFGTSYTGTISSVKANSLTLEGNKSDVSVIITNGTSTNGYVKDTDLRLYNGYTMTISVPESFVITNIGSTVGGKNFTTGIVSDLGSSSISDNQLHWSGSSNKVIFTVSGTVSFETITINYTPAPAVKTLKSIAISDYTTVFTRGDEFAFGGKVMASYEEDGVADADVTSLATFSGYDMSTVGTQTVTVSYTEGEITKNATYDITVNAPVTITSIAISGTPSKLTYKVGDAFDTDDLIATATYSDGTQGDVTEHTTWTVSPETFTEAGENINVSVTATYEGVTSEPVNYIVTVEEAPTPSNVFTLVTDASQLVAGNEYIIATRTDEGDFALSTNSVGSSSNTREAIKINSMSADAKTINYIEGISIFTLLGINGFWTFENNNNYLYSKDNNNSLYYGGELDCSSTERETSITIESNNCATIVFNKYPRNDKDYLRYIQLNLNIKNNIPTTPRFAGYGSNSNMIPVYLYMRSGAAPTVATPVITPNGGKFDGEQEVTITCETADVDIYYTTNGTEPTSDSELYTGPFTINESCTVKAIAVDADDNASDVASADFISSQLTHVKNIAEFLALPDGTDAIFDNPVTVLYDYSQHSKTGQEYIWIKDGSAYTQLFVTPQFDEDFIAKYVNGDVIPAGFVATKNFYDSGKYYQGLINDENGKATFQDATTKALADPELITFDEFSSINANDDTDLANWNNRYVLLKNVKFSSKDNYNSYISDGTTGTRAGSNVAYNKFSVTVPNDDYVAYNVYAIIQKWNSVWEILPIAFEPYAEQTLTLKELVTKGNAGETDTETTYTIGNELQVVEYIESQNILLVKDDNGQAVNPVKPAESDKNYVIHATSDFNGNGDMRNEKAQTDYDQSNWLEVVIPATVDGNDFVGKIIKAGTIKGSYTDTMNPRLVLDANATLTAKEGAIESYYRNPMCAANFAGSQDGYFFMTPKPNELVQVVWAVYDNGYFYMPDANSGNSYGFAGKIASGNLTYNDTKEPGLQNGYAYQFKAIVKKAAQSSAAPRKVMTDKTFGHQNCDDESDGFTLYPINLAHNENIVTGVDGVNSSKAVESVKFFNLQGAEFGEMQPGVNIMVIKFTDGTTLSSKVIK